MIEIDVDGKIRQHRASFEVCQDGVGLLRFERSSGAETCIRIPHTMLPSVKPEVIEAYTAEDHRGNGHTFGPFLNKETAIAVAHGRGEWGADGGVTKARYITWSNERGETMGHAVLGDAVKLRSTPPSIAALEAVLGSLSPQEREIVEAAIACR